MRVRLPAALAATAGLAAALVAGLALRFPLLFELPIAVWRHESTTSLVSLARWIAYMHPYLAQVRWNAARGQKDFAAADAALQPGNGADLLERGQLDWHLGDFASAVARIEAYHRESGESEESLFWLALSYMRLAEAENCLDRLLEDAGQGSHADHYKMCALPLDMHHRRELYSRKAAASFVRLLDEYDSEHPIYRWLLNFSYMTVDGFPGEVPERYRLSGGFVDHFYGDVKREMEIKYSHLRLRDRAKELGIARLSSSADAVVEDFNGDGYLDVITGAAFRPVAYFENEGGKRFVDKSEESGLAAVRGTHMMSGADYDNDGWIDVFISRVYGSRLGDFVLMRNNGDGTFSDVTVAAGLLPPESERTERALTWISTWGDLENDGDLDLFIGTWAFYNGTDSSTYWLPFAGNMESRLYRNDAGRFTDVTREFGIDRVVRGRNVFGAAFGDFDRDGFADLALTPQWIPSVVLLRNEGGERFAEADVLQGEAAWGFMTTFVDVNHDGRLDLFVGGAGSAYGVTQQAVFGASDDFHTSSAIWLQRRDGSFQRREDLFAGDMPLATMGASFGDLDLDGAYDFYLGTGNPEGWLVLPNLMFMGIREGGVPTGRMENVSMLHGLGTIQKGHGIVFFDFDEDGDQDLYSSLGGMWPGDAWPDQLFVNESELDHGWVKIRLRGRRSNRFGVGARIEVFAREADGRVHSYHYHMTNKTSFGSAPYLAHMGLADAVAIDRVEVTWPGAATPRVYAAEVGASVLLDEDEGLPRARRGP